MATVNQINFRLDQAKKKLAALNEEYAATKANVKKLESEFKKSRIALIAKAAEKRKAKNKQIMDQFI